MSKFMKLIVQLLTWNGAKYIPKLFESLRKQTLKDWKFYILDNSSSDNTVELTEKELDNFTIPYEIELGRENLGFAGGHNYLFKKSDAEYFMLLNQDLYLQPDCLEKLVNFLDNNRDAATVSPRLMKWDFDDNLFTNKIDSLGLKVTKCRRVIDWRQGEDWNKASADKQALEVFGVSGTAPMFRRKAIGRIVFSDSYFFDKNYGSYKEDVDLSYRLRSAGFRAFVLLGAAAYHDRSSSLNQSVVKNKKLQPAHIRHNSYKNHLMTLYKNEYGQNFILDFPWILWYEIRKFVWFLLFDRMVLRGWKEIWAWRKELKAKRLEIKKLRKIDWREMRQWFN